MQIGDYIASWNDILPQFSNHRPWHIEKILSALFADILAQNDIFYHPSSTIEDGATIKGPCWIGPDCFVAASAYLRGGVWLEKNCIVGPACELKTTMMLDGAKAAHLNFVGDSIVGAHANIEAGAIIANYRNEHSDKQIRIRLGSQQFDCGVDKFGALVGDSARIGAIAVLAPGTIIKPNQVVPRLALVDQHPDAKG